MNFYMTKEYSIATNYLRENGLNSITWEHFTGDYTSVLHYLERIAIHVWEKFQIDETEVFGSIFHKNTIAKWAEENKPTAKELNGHTHIVMHGYTDEDTYVTVLTVDELKQIENNIHCAILNGLEQAA